MHKLMSYVLSLKLCPVSSAHTSHKCTTDVSADVSVGLKLEAGDQCVARLAQLINGLYMVMLDVGGYVHAVGSARDLILYTKNLLNLLDSCGMLRGHACRGGDLARVSAKLMNQVSSYDEDGERVVR